MEQNQRVLIIQKQTKDSSCLLPWAVATMNSQSSTSTGFSHYKLFHGGHPAWFSKAPSMWTIRAL